MPASLSPVIRGAGIQGLQAEACRSASWIPGLALLARNDDTANPLSISRAWYLGRTRFGSLLVGLRLGVLLLALHYAQLIMDFFHARARFYQVFSLSFRLAIVYAAFERLSGPIHDFHVLFLTSPYDIPPQ